MTTVDATIRKQVNDVLLFLADVYAREGRPGGDLAGESLVAATKGSIDLEPSAWPEELITLANTQEQALPIISTIVGCASVFKWSNWGEEILDGQVSGNLYFTELVGPDGLFADTSVRVGLQVSDKFIDYPLSSHAGEETHYVLSGTAHWILEGQDYIEKAPGSYVYHPAWKAHGRRTGGQIYLGAWRWSGDLDLDSFRLDQ